MKQKSDYQHGDLKNALIDEAVKAMTKTKDASFTLRDLAKKIGVSHTAVYRHFPNRLAVLAAVAEDGFTRLAKTLHEANAKGRSAHDYLVMQARHYLKFAIDYPTHYRAMFTISPNERMEFTSMCQAGADAFLALQDACQQLITENKLKNTDLEKLTLAFWSLTHGISMLVIDEQLKTEASKTIHKKYDNLVQFMATSMLKGILGE